MDLYQQLRSLAGDAIKTHGEEKSKNTLLELLNYLATNSETGDTAEWMNCLHACEQSDNFMLDSGITALIPKPSVALGSCYIGFTVNTQAIPYAKSLKSDKSQTSLVMYWSAYEELLRLTEGFDYMPTITLPIHLGNHWGMCIVIPEPDKGEATIFWGDSLGYTPPPGLLPFFRALLFLKFRHTTIRIDRRNYMSDILGFENQRDTYSCGFYVLAAFSTLCEGSKIEMEVPGLYHRYRAVRTEQYRSFCFSKLVRDVLKAQTEPSQILPAVAVAMANERRHQAAITNGSVVMYSGKEGREKLRAVVNLISAHDLVENVDGNEEIPMVQGMYSPSTLQAKPRPMVSCLISSSATAEKAVFLDVIDSRTVQQFEKAPGQIVCNEINLRVSEEDEEPSITPSSPETTIPTPRLSTPSSSIDAAEGEKKELLQHSDNFFSHVKRLMMKGHILAYPYVKNYVKPHWLIRVRLRCRRYKVPKRMAASSYKKCEARLLQHLEVLNQTGRQGRRLS